MQTRILETAQIQPNADVASVLATPSIPATAPARVGKNAFSGDLTIHASPTSHDNGSPDWPRVTGLLTVYFDIDGSYSFYPRREESDALDGDRGEDGTYPNQLYFARNEPSTPRQFMEDLLAFTKKVELALNAEQSSPPRGRNVAPAIEDGSAALPGKKSDDSETWCLRGPIGYRRSTGNSKTPFSTPTEYSPGMVSIQRIGDRWYVDGIALDWDGQMIGGLFSIKGEREAHWFDAPEADRAN